MTQPKIILSLSGILSLLALSGLLLLLFTGLVVLSLPQAFQAHTQHKSSTSQTPPPAQIGLLTFPGSDNDIPPLQFPAGEQHVLYEWHNKIYSVSTRGGPGQVLLTPGYIYNQAVSPVLLQSGQLLYSGNGVWLTNGDNNVGQQIAALPPGQVITSMVLSSDETMLAWSTEPANGKGEVSIYAGPLQATHLVYQQTASDCPCFRVFSFFAASGKAANTMLLLTDDRGDHHAVQFGMWILDLNIPGESPQQVMDEDPPQGPLAIVPGSNTLLYSQDEEVAPAPTDGSVPEEVAASNYANSLSIANIDDKSLQLNQSYDILPQQPEQSNIAGSRWAASPMFSPDGHTLVYVLFSSDGEIPFDRHSALYTVQVSGSGAQLRVSQTRLLASSNAGFVELGPWLDNRVLSFYADSHIYAVDTHSGAVAMLVRTGSYARIFAVQNS